MTRPAIAPPEIDPEEEFPLLLCFLDSVGLKEGDEEEGMIEGDREGRKEGVSVG